MPLTLYPVLVYRANQDWLLKLRPLPSVDGADYSDMYANDRVSKAKFKFAPATTENNLKWKVQVKFHDLIDAIWFTDETEFDLENVPAFPMLPTNISTQDPHFIQELEGECIKTFSHFCQHMDMLAKDTTSANAKKTLEAALASLSSTFTAQVVLCKLMKISLTNLHMVRLETRLHKKKTWRCRTSQRRIPHEEEKRTVSAQDL
jgi:hypothetical protein